MLLYLCLGVFVLLLCVLFDLWVFLFLLFLVVCACVLCGMLIFCGDFVIRCSASLPFLCWLLVLVVFSPLAVLSICAFVFAVVSVCLCVFVLCVFVSALWSLFFVFFV